MADPTDSKFQKTVTKATGGEANTPAVVLESAAAMITSFDPQELREIAKAGKHEFAPQMMSLEEGQKIIGILEGYGPGNEFENEEGVVRHVDSWIIASQDGSMRVSILSSAQLDRKLPPFIGEMVGIAREKNLRISNGHQVANYHVWGPRAAPGKKRTWASLHGTVSAQPQLPPGVTNANPTANGAVPHEDTVA